jgi:MFS family permease
MLAADRHASVTAVWIASVRRRLDRLLAPEFRKLLSLVAVAFGLFLIMLDTTVVNVALPSIRRDLGISISELECVVNGYGSPSASCLLTGGKLADLIGRSRIFIVGLAIFTASSFFCGFAGQRGMAISIWRHLGARPR